MSLSGTISASPKVADVAMEGSQRGAACEDPRVRDILIKLTAAQSFYEASWKDTFLRFPALVEELQAVSQAHQSGDSDRVEKLQAGFFESLNSELTKASRVFHNTARQLRQTEEKGRLFGKKRGRLVPRVMFSMNVGSGVKVSATREHTYTHSVYCSVYAQLHREALRVLLAYHDSLIPGNLGDLYIAQVWEANDSRGLFLHSALLREVDAVLYLMRRKLGAERCSELVPAAIASLHSTGSDYSQGESQLGLGKAKAAEEGSNLATVHSGAPVTLPAHVHLQEDNSVPENLKPLISCPVCLDYMYRPHGLDCGHCMCTPCLLIANKMEQGVAPSLRAMMTHMPYKRGRCPICRQPMVNPPAELTALGRVVKKAAPDYFQACDSTFLAKQEANREAFEQKMMKELEVDKNPLFPVLDKIPSLFGSKSTAST